MLHCDIIDVSQGIDPAKDNNIKECMVCHYWYFNYGFKFQNFVSSGCFDLTMLCLNLNDIAAITVKYVDYPCIFYGISKSEAIHLLKNSVLDDVGIYKIHINIKNRICSYTNSLIELEKLETKKYFYQLEKL